MYETCFNLTDRPFASTPRTDHFFPAPVIEAARKTLIRCVDRGEGVGIVIGPSGTGKTLLCELLAEHFRAYPKTSEVLKTSEVCGQAFQVALLTGAHMDSRRTLLQAILYELRQPYRGMDEGELRLALIDYITLSEDCGRGVLLLVDEAHQLPLRLLDEVRTLTNLMRDNQPAVRLVLAGSRALEERFASPKLESFSQRLAARCYLEAFQRQETQEYLYARIAACGGEGAQIFPPETCQMVHKATDGVPRLINQVCDHVLLLAYAAGRRQIEPAHIEEAWADLQQLPTPWNAPAQEPAANVIEFGGLDDEPAEDAGEAVGRVFQPVRDGLENPSYEDAAATGLRISETPDEAVGGDVEPAERIRHIQQLLTDVQEEFRPSGSIGPEIELSFDDGHPFREEFAEEEVVSDRYKTLAACKAATSGRGNDCKAATIGRGDDCKAATSGRGSMPDAEPAAVATAVLDEDDGGYEDKRPVRPVRTIVPARRRQYDRLFAKLRQGS